MKTFTPKLVFLSLTFLLCIPSIAQKCIDLGVGIEMGNEEYALIDFFKNNQCWVVSDGAKEWYGCDNMNEFKVVNGAYYNYDRNWSCDIDNDSWNEPWDDTYISYWDMMVDQGLIRPDGYPTHFPSTIYRYKTKEEDPAQPIDSTEPIDLTSFTRRMYFPQGLPRSGWIMKWEGTGTIRFQGLENVVADAGTSAELQWESWTPAGYGFAGYNYIFQSTGEGRIETDLHWMVHGWVLEIEESDPNDPIRNVVFLFPGLEDEYDAGLRFNPQYLERMSQFNSLRYMGYLNSNRIESRRIMADCNPFYYTDMLNYLDWNERTPENYYCLNNGNGGNYEYIIELSNLTNTDPWVNIPFCADESYTDSLVRLFMNKLNPDLTLYLEVGNELWNFAQGFDGFRWQAALRVVEYPGLGDVEARGAHINRIFGRVTEVAGSNLSRIQRVYAGFPRYTDVNNRTLNYIDKANWDAFATTWYFNLPQDADGNGCTEAETGLNWRSVLYNWWQENPNDQDGFNEMYRYCLLEQFRCSGGYSGNSDVVLAKYYGKDIVCYEGGNHSFYGCENGPTGGALNGELDFDTPDYPDYITDNGFINAVAVADESNPVAEVYEEVIDSMQSAGIRLANHLSFAGRSSCYGVWSFIQPRDLMDPLDELLAKYGKFRVFSERIQNSNCTQLEIVLEADTIGSGLSLLFDGIDDYIEIPESSPANLSEAQDFTFEMWIKPTKLNRRQSILHSAINNEPNSSFSLYLREDNNFLWEIYNNGSRELKLIGSELELDKWTHIAISHNNSNSYCKLYINGVVVASAIAPISNVSYNSISLGANPTNNSSNFCGEIDEFRLWDTERSKSELRDFMCKKVPSTYTGIINLRMYLKFDTPDYEQMRLIDYSPAGSEGIEIINMNISKRSRFAVSGAPIGNYSSNIYTANWEGISLNLTHPQGDFAAVSNIEAGNPNGVHIYFIDGTPYYHDAPEYYDSTSSHRTVGVFTANGNNASFDILYMYEGNPDANSNIPEDDFRLLKRNDYSDETWMNLGAIQNKTNNSFLKGCSERYRGEYTLAFRHAENPIRPGSGMALRNPQTPTGNVQGLIRYLDLYDYTVSFWAKGWGEVFNLTGKYKGNEQKFTLSPAYAEGLNCGIRYSRNWGNTQYISPSGRIALLDEWKYYTVTREGTKITIYVNGVEVASDHILSSYKIEEMYLFNDPEWQTGNYIDGHADLTIDELSVWNTALDEQTIRDWMCRKVTSEHPYECENLVLYFNFDEGSGSILEDRRGPSDIVLSTDSEGFQWVRSGAAVGDVSVHDYVSSGDILMTHPQGDSLVAERTSGSSFGVHLYRIDNAPPVPSTVGTAEIISMDSSRYWGFYVADAYESVNSYNLTYFYAQNQQVNLANENEIRILSRYDNSTNPWQTEIANTPNTALNSIQITNQDRGEYILGGTSANTFIPFEAPEMPAFTPSSEDTNKVSFCANEQELLFSVERNPMATQYRWILPAELNGYSETNIITLTSNFQGTETVIRNIGAIAINNYGQSDTAWLQVSINPQTTIADAGPDQIILPPVTVATLNANFVNEPEFGTWSVLQGDSGVQFTSGNSPTTEVSSFTPGVSVLQWEISNPTCPTSADSVQIVYAPSPERVLRADGLPLTQVYCVGEIISLLVVPTEDTEPSAYQWNLPSGMTLLSQTNNEADILIENGIGGTIEVSAIYSGVSSEPYQSPAIGISPSPAPPVFLESDSILCLNVDKTIRIAESAQIDSVVWEMPYGIYPTDYPKSTGTSIKIQGIFEVEGYVKVTTFYNGCSSSEARDSLFMNVNLAPDKPVLYLGTDGGTADPMCRNDKALLWVENNDLTAEYEWTWQTSISHLEYFGNNRNAALFDMPGGNATVQVRAVTNAPGCNLSEWNVFNGWVWNETPSNISNIQITDPASQNLNDITVGEIYTIEVTGTGENYFWDLPEGLELVNDGNLYNNQNQIRVVSETAGSIRVFPITLEGCAGNAINLNLSVAGTLYPPEYVSGALSVCEGELTEIALTDVGATEYIWTFPDGSEYTTELGYINVSLSNAQKGTLSIVASNGSYRSLPLEFEFEVLGTNIEATGFCDADGNAITSYEVCSRDSRKPIYHRNANAIEYIWDIRGSAIQFEPRWEPGHEDDRDYELTNRTSPVDTMMPISWVDWRCRNDGTDEGYIYVTAMNGCGGEDVKDSIYYYWAIPMHQQVPEFTQAPTEVCVGSSVSYQINPIPFAEQYVWHLPSGLTVSTNVTEQPAITAEVVNGTGGELEVYAVSNVCGLSNTTVQRTGSISIGGEPLDFHFTQAPTAGCEGEDITYSVNDIGADTYTWYLPEALTSYVIDDSSPDVVFTGNWRSRDRANLVNGSMRWADNNNASNLATYTPNIEETGMYEVWISYYTNWDTRNDVPVTVNHSTGSFQTFVDMQSEPEDGIWHKIGEFQFSAGQGNSVAIGTNANGGNISIADAVKFVRTGIEGGTSYTTAVANGEIGAVCVEVESSTCSTPYKICSEPVNYTGELAEPIFTAQENSVCVGFEYTYRINDIGADTYIWELPEGLSSNSQTGTVNTSTPRLSVRIDQSSDVPVFITVHGTIAGCNLASSVISSNPINFDGDDCKLNTPLFIQPDSMLIVSENATYTVTAINGADSYLWILPEGIQQIGTAATGEVTTTEPYIEVELSGTAFGSIGTMRVIATSGVLQWSDTASTAFNISGYHSPTIDIELGWDPACAGGGTPIQNNSSFPDTYSPYWYFGENASPRTSSENSPGSVVFNTSGVHSGAFYLIDGDNDTLQFGLLDFTIEPQPTAILSGNDTLRNGTATVHIDFTGTPPFNIQLNEGWINDITETSYNHAVSDTGTYQINSFEAGNCRGTISGFAHIEMERAAIHVILSGNDTVCGQASGHASLEVFGNESVSYTIASETDTVRGVAEPGNTRLTLPRAGTYSISTISSESGNEATYEGEATLTVLVTIPEAFFATNTSACPGEQGIAEFVLTATPPITFIYAVNDEMHTDILNTNTIDVSYYPNDIITVYSVTGRYCSFDNIQESIQTTEYEIPSAQISGDTIIQNGGSATLNVQFTGNAPWDIALSNGSTFTNITTHDYTFEVTETGTYSITSVSDKNCVGVSTGSASVENIPQGLSGRIWGSDTICEGETATIYFEMNGQNDAIYRVRSETETFNGDIIQGVLTSIEVSETGTYKLELFDSWGNKGETSDSAIILVIPAPSVPLLVEIEIENCEPIVTATILSKVEGSLYTWTAFGDLMSETENSVTYKYENTGWSTLILTESNECFTRDTIIDLLFKGSSINIVGPDTICKSTETVDYTVQLRGQATVPFGWSTSFLSSNDTEYDTLLPIVLNSYGEHYIAVHALAGDSCTVIDTLQLLIKPLPQTRGARRIFHCFQESPSITVEADSGFQWYYYEELTAYAPSEIFYEPGVFTYTLIEDGCETADSVMIIENCTVSLVIPDAFTPNNDGLNDELRMIGHSFESFEFIIVNNWGELLFRSTDIEDCWDGTYRGEDAQEGTYTWHASITADGVTEARSGKVVLQR